MYISVNKEEPGFDIYVELLRNQHMIEKRNDKYRWSDGFGCDIILISKLS